jgi:hypothetical protein
LVLLQVFKHGEQSRTLTGMFSERVLFIPMCITAEKLDAADDGI